MFTSCFPPFFRGFSAACARSFHAGIASLLRLSRESMFDTHDCFFGLCTCPATSMTLLLLLQLLLCFRVCTEVCPEEGACGEVAHVFLGCLLLLAFVRCCCVFPHSTAAGGRQLSLSHIHCAEHMCDATQLTWFGLFGGRAGDNVL